MVHEDDIDVGKDEHIVEIERKIVIMAMEILWLWQWKLESLMTLMMKRKGSRV